MSKRIVVVVSGMAILVMIVASVYVAKLPVRSNPAAQQALASTPATVVSPAIQAKNQPTEIAPAYQKVALQAAKQVESWYNQPLPALIAECEKRLREHPQDIPTNWKLAQVYLFADQNRAKALPYLMKILELDPQHKEIETIRFWIQTLQQQQQIQNQGIPSCRSFWPKSGDQHNIHKNHLDISKWQRFMRH